MTAIFQDCEKTPVVSDKLTILVTTPIDVWEYLFEKSSWDNIKFTGF